MMIILTFLLFSYFLTLLAIQRKYMVAHFLTTTILMDPKHRLALKRMWLLGFRFDLQVTAILLILPYFISTLLSFFNLTYSIIAIIYSSIIFILSFIFIGLVIGNYFYYKTYHKPYDIFMFGLIEDDTKAILRNIYDDYPIIKMIIIIFLLSGLASYMSFIFINTMNTTDNYLFSLFTIILLVLIIRGTLQSKPLGEIHSQVSSLMKINYMVPNGVIAFKWATQSYLKQTDFIRVDENNGKELAKHLFNKITFTEKTEFNPFLEKNKPNVVFVLMESFGQNILQFDHAEKNDLLGALRTPLNDSYVFERFLPSYNGTASSLFSLFFYNTNQNLAQSTAKDTVLPHSAFLPYKKQGYKIIFITSGNGMWRNVAPYFYTQGADEIYDHNDIIDRYHEAKKTLSYWGVADEYSFKLAEQLLNETKQPLFIHILTITNHPPYQAPIDYIAKKIDPTVLKERIGKDNTERKNILEVYQYACNALGNFITNIKNSNLNNTIISATGDHHLRGVTQYSNELFVSYSVPFIIHMPDVFKDQIEIDFNKEKIGSHKDIMPTLYSISLSNTEYWNEGGRNLFSSETLPHYNFGYNSNIWIDEKGVVDLSNKPYQRYLWNENKRHTLETSHFLSNDEIKQIDHYQQWLNWQTHFLVKGKQ